MVCTTVCTTRRRSRAGAVARLLLLLVAAGAMGCKLLDVSDPTAILERDVDDATGAELLRQGALRALYLAVGESAWYSGLFADEFLTQRPASFEFPEELLDRRASAELIAQSQETFGSYASWQSLWLRQTPVALAKLRAYAVPGVREAHLGELYAVRGYAALRLAEDFCPGFPLHDLVDYTVRYGPPLSTEEAFATALAAFDSAVSWAADSARVLNFARVGRARTLLNLGRYAEASAAVAAVPTSYVYQTEFNTTAAVTNTLGSEPGWPLSAPWGVVRSVADREGGNGLDFVSAHDPRVATVQRGTARDGVTLLYGVAKYPNKQAPIVVAGGIEARLIEAEAALRANPNDPQWLAILNDLRRNWVTPALADTTDPGTDAARVDLLFRERAFWLFATGHRLGDLRRLVRQYGRASEAVFPTGPYWFGDLYSTGTSLPFDKQEAQFSPGVTGCTSW